MSIKKQQVWGSHLEESPAAQNVLFCAGRDVQTLPMADEVLLPYDIWTNRAHAIMLWEQKIIPKTTLLAILTGLDELASLTQRGDFQLDPQKEDVHINVESFITEKYGIEVGGRMHTGRSRNDQIACDMRLYLRQACLQLGEALLELAAHLILHAQAHRQTVMPGFTHYQPGMITTWGHWVGSYIQGLLRDLERVDLSFRQVNRNPLGAAAAFGTSWPIDRQKTTELLGFEQIELNTLDCIVARWENEAHIAQSYAFVMNHLSVIAQDLIFLSMPYVGMLAIDESMVTGSSIMPQKRNPDFAEVIKGKACLVHGALVSLLEVQKGGLSGFNRDTQVTKYLIMDIIRECEAAPSILKSVFENLKIHAKAMEQYCKEGFMNAVDVADYLTRTLKLSFRECYNILALSVKYSKDAGQITSNALRRAMAESGCEQEMDDEAIVSFNDPHFVLEQRQHQGAPAPQAVSLQIKHLSEQVSQHQASFQGHRQSIDQAYEKCRTYQPS